MTAEGIVIRTALSNVTSELAFRGDQLDLEDLAELLARARYLLNALETRHWMKSTE